MSAFGHLTRMVAQEQRILFWFSQDFITLWFLNEIQHLIAR